MTATLTTRERHAKLAKANGWDVHEFGWKSRFNKGDLELHLTYLPVQTHTLKLMTRLASTCLVKTIEGTDAWGMPVKKVIGRQVGMDKFVQQVLTQ
jgi:hypothetical protein